MKYETPQLLTLTDAVNAIQDVPKAAPPAQDSHDFEVIAAYQDWEE
jgi:hypothetical protein